MSYKVDQRKVDYIHARLNEFIMFNFGESATKNLNNNIKDLKISVSFLQNLKRSSGTYSNKKNQIKLRPNQKSLSHEMIHMASNDLSRKNRGGGIAYRGQGVALNEGITQYINSIAFNYNFKSYQFETFVAASLREIYDIKIFESYFKNQPHAFMLQFNEEEQICIRIIMKELDKILKYRREHKRISEEMYVKVISNLCKLADLRFKLKEYFHFVDDCYLNNVFVDYEMHEFFLDVYTSEYGKRRLY